MFLVETINRRFYLFFLQMKEKAVEESKRYKAEELLVKFDDRAATVHMMGWKKQVQEYSHFARNLSQQLERQLEKSKQMITEEVQLKKHQVLLLLACKFVEISMQDNPELKMEADVRSNKVLYSGLPNHIVASKAKLYEMLNDTKSKTLDVSENYVKVRTIIPSFTIQ